MKSFKAKRVIRTGTLRLTGTPAEIFPLLCPIREYDWIEGWRCDLIYSDSGVAEEGCIFQTDFPADQGRELWVVSRYEPEEIIEFVRLSPDVKLIKLDIRLSLKEDGVTEALWRQTVTGLSDEGNDWIEHYSQEAYGQTLSILETMLNHYLSTGEKLTGLVTRYRTEHEKG